MFAMKANIMTHKHRNAKIVKWNIVLCAMVQVINVVHALVAMNLNKALRMIMFAKKSKMGQNRLIRCTLEYLLC